MAAKTKGAAYKVDVKQGPPKRTRQGAGQHSRPKKGQKRYQGQGR
tara:strand:+ start:87 stop:221 length:135 start_codon:yes stop_codon:yes gene_type:complete